MGLFRIISLPRKLHCRSTPWHCTPGTQLVLLAWEPQNSPPPLDFPCHLSLSPGSSQAPGNGRSWSPGRVCATFIAFIRKDGCAGWSRGRKRICRYGGREVSAGTAFHASMSVEPQPGSLWSHRLQRASSKTRFHFQRVGKPLCFFKKWERKRKVGLESLSGNACRVQIFESSTAKPEWLLNHNKSYLAFLQCLSSYVLFTNINTWSSTTHLAKYCAVWELLHPSSVDDQTCGVGSDPPRPASDRISATAVGTWPRSPDHQPALCSSWEISFPGSPVDLFIKRLGHWSRK